MLDENFRRMIGLFGAFYAAVHLFAWARQYGFDWPFLGEEIVSFALTNVRKAYGLDLEYLKDSDGDGFPDVIDPAPFKKGYKDGDK